VHWVAADGDGAVASEPNRKDSDFIGALRDQLALISVLILFAGFRYVEAYYSWFGIRLSNLDLSIQYLIYRGLTSIFSDWWISGVYLLSVGWLIWCSIQPFDRAKPKAYIQFISYSVIIIAVVVTYFAEANLGTEAFKDDATLTTSRLPRIKGILDERDAQINSMTGLRILYDSRDELILFNPVQIRGAIPNLIILKREDVDALDVER
jgi:hypothetical protein